MKSTLRHLVFAGLTFALGVIAPAGAATLDAVEYYNATLDHYFVTALPSEITKLDAGAFVGWQRTNCTFKVFDPATPASNALPVCRFYGLPEAGIDSHFYSASAAECDDVLRRFPGVWVEETSNAFGIFLPDPQTGQCPANSIPVYRSWNNRADSNHRFTTDPSVQRAMLAKGYVAEGYGPGPLLVAMCAPAEGGPGPVPACVVTASAMAPTVGAMIVLSATCSNLPTTFTWTGCASATSTCSTTSSAVGQAAYTVVAANAAGASPPATLTLGWAASPPTPPGLCGAFPSYLYSDLGGQSGRVESAALVPPPGFAWNGAWAVSFTVPATIGSLIGRVSAAEFAGEPTVREATISRKPCDFRPTDRSGVNGPFARASGISVTNWFTAIPTQAGYPVLQAGGSYYYNVRNWEPSSGTISCPASPGRCDAFVEAVLPR